MAEIDLFKKLLKTYHERPGKEYALNQLANLVLGKGDPKNAAIIGRTLNQFRQYFGGKNGTLVQTQLFPCLTRRRGGIGAAEKEVYGNSSLSVLLYEISFRGVLRCLK